jgi:hypothetical protein
MFEIQDNSMKCPESILEGETPRMAQRRYVQGRFQKKTSKLVLGPKLR